MYIVHCQVLQGIKAISRNHVNAKIMHFYTKCFPKNAFSNV